MKYLFITVAIIFGFISCSSEDGERKKSEEVVTSEGEHVDLLVFAGEQSVFSNIRQLTFGGENAEGYFSYDETKFIYQRTSPEQGDSCDQIYIYDLESGISTRVSTGFGRTTCAYFLPGDSLILYASTHRADSTCPPVPDHSRGYVWPLYPGYDIYLADADGTIKTMLAESPYYDAEATVSPAGDKIVFTSTRTGDIELFSMNIDGSDVTQLTDVPGYDGGAFYSWDGKKIVFRASRHEGEDLKSYRKLLAEDLVRPSVMELYVMNADGSEMRQITDNGAANFAPFWHPDGEHIIFASNVGDPKGRNFDLYLIKQDGSEMTQLTFNETFDGFPMFTSDGKSLIFASNRNNARQGETNLFLAKFAMPESK